MRVLGTEPRSSTRTASAKKYISVQDVAKTECFGPLVRN